MLPTLRLRLRRGAGARVSAGGTSSLVDDEDFPPWTENRGVSGQPTAPAIQRAQKSRVAVPAPVGWQ